MEIFVIGYLQLLQRQTTIALPIVSPNLAKVNLQNILENSIPAKSVLNQRDVSALAILDELKKKGQWPRKRDRLKQFVECEELNALRLYKSECVTHNPVKLELSNKESRKKCVLCCRKNVGRNATHYCSICLVPLCTTLFRGIEGQGSMMSCFQHFSFKC